MNEITLFYIQDIGVQSVQNPVFSIGRPADVTNNEVTKRLLIVAYKFGVYQCSGGCSKDLEKQSLA